MSVRGSRKRIKRPDYDQALKELFQRDPAAVLALLRLRLTWVRQRSPELPSRPRQADLVWEVELPDGRRGLLHLELQTKPDAKMGERVAEYALRLWLRDHLPVYSVVIYFRPSEALAVSPFGWFWDEDDGRMQYKFETIRLWEVPQEEVLETPYYHLWPLAGVMKDTSADAALEVAERLASAPLPRKERIELTGALALLAGIRVPKANLAQAFRRNPMIEEFLRESSFTEMVHDLFREEDEARGMRRMTQVALEGRFGPLSEDLLAALGAADQAALEAIAAHLTTDDLAEVRARLGLE